MLSWHPQTNPGPVQPARIERSSVRFREAVNSRRSPDPYARTRRRHQVDTSFMPCQPQPFYYRGFLRSVLSCKEHVTGKANMHLITTSLKFIAVSRDPLERVDDKVVLQEIRMRRTTITDRHWIQCRILLWKSSKTASGHFFESDFSDAPCHSG